MTQRLVNYIRVFAGSIWFVSAKLLMVILEIITSWSVEIIEFKMSLLIDRFVTRRANTYHKQSYQLFLHFAVTQILEKGGTLFEIQDMPSAISNFSDGYN